MALSQQLSVITPVSRPALLPIVAASLPPEAEWILVTDGPQDIPPGLRAHVLIEGPRTGRWGDVQRQVGLEAASRPFVTFLDDDNLMLPGLAELVIPTLAATGRAGALFGLLFRHPGGLYIWPPPTRVERSQVDTAMFLGRTDAARRVGWPDLHGGDWPQLAGQRCGDFVFIRAFDEAAGLLRLPAICGFHDGVALVRDLAPEVYAAIERGDPAGDVLLGLLHRHMNQADAPPWWKGRQAEPAPAGGATPLSSELLELAGSSREGSSVPAQRAHFQALVRGLAADRPGQAVNVLEVGFNAGLGAAAFLEASPQVHVVSFDLAEHPYVVACAQHLRTRFPDRLQLVMGDSLQTLPRFAAATGARFDLVLIDGGHEEATCRADIANARAAAGPGAPVVVDDLMPHKGYGAGVCRAWDGLLREGVLTDPEIWRAPPGALAPEADAGEPPEGCERRWGVARYAGG
jgi:predicted O-methyltransferase YrrM